jgi:hypothetical protein
MCSSLVSQRRLCERATAADAAAANNAAADGDDDVTAGAQGDEARMQSVLRVLALLGYDEATSSTGMSVLLGLSGDDADALLELVVNLCHELVRCARDVLLT